MSQSQFSTPIDRRIAAITADLARRQPTRGDAFTMEIEGRTLTQRKAAGVTLLTKLRLAARARDERRWTIGNLGGFALTGVIRPGRQDVRLEPELLLERTDFAQPIGIAGETTPAGLIARLEHALDRLEGEIEEHRRRLADAETRLSGYGSRLSEVFPLQGELNARLDQLAEIKTDLASTEGVAGTAPPTRARAA